MTANDKSTPESSTGLLPMLMTRSTIADRHRRRRERTLQTLTRITPSEQTLKPPALPFNHNISGDDSIVFNIEQQRQASPAASSSASLYHVLLAACVGGGLAEWLFGSRRGSTISRKPNLLTTFQSDGGALAFQQQQLQHQPILLKNRLRAVRVLGAAGATSLLFGTKHYMQQRNGNSVLSSAIAGAAMATVTLPLHHLSHCTAATATTTWMLLSPQASASAGLQLLQSVAVFSKTHAPRIYAREMTGAIALFGIYESLAGRDSSSTTTIMGAGAVAGAAHRSLVGGTAAAALRSMPLYAILFWGYENTLQLCL